MSALLSVCMTIWRPHWRRLVLGTLSAIAVGAMGVALIGVSGWFITAAGLAGAAGLGIAFDVFRPSAAIRLLAFGRAATRYGERLAVHDATFRGLARLRSTLLAAASRAPIRELQAMRASQRLNRLTADVDALDGVASRLLVPLLSAIILVPCALAIWWLVAPQVALSQLGAFALGVAAAFLVTWLLGRAPVRRMQYAQQALRSRFIEGARAQAELAVAGRIENHVNYVLHAHDRLQKSQRDADLADRLGTFAISFGAAVAATASLWIGATLVREGSLSLPMAAAGFFVSLGLAEIVGPLARAAHELTRAADAARRIFPTLTTRSPAGRTTSTADADGDAPVLELKDVGYSENGREIMSGISLALRPGETVALAGPSGAGKSTLLLLALGQLVPLQGQVLLLGRDVSTLSEQAMLDRVSLLPQRNALMSGTILDALRLADPRLSEAAAWEVLDTVRLADMLRLKGGLGYRLGESGAGLSGGQQRRLALARVLLRRPRLLLLDEPIEGLDADAARQVLEGIRNYLGADTAILLASHSRLEMEWCDRLLRLDMAPGQDAWTLTNINAAAPNTARFKHASEAENREKVNSHGF